MFKCRFRNEPLFAFLHDESGAVNTGISKPPTVEDNIARIDDWITAVRKRRKVKAVLKSDSFCHKLWKNLAQQLRQRDPIRCVHCTRLCSKWRM